MNNTDTAIHCLRVAAQQFDAHEREFATGPLPLLDSGAAASRLADQFRRQALDARTLADALEAGELGIVAAEAPAPTAPGAFLSDDSANLAAGLVSKALPEVADVSDYLSGGDHREQLDRALELHRLADALDMVELQDAIRDAIADRLGVEPHAAWRNLTALAIGKNPEGVTPEGFEAEAAAAALRRKQSASASPLSATHGELFAMVREWVQSDRWSDEGIERAINHAHQGRICAPVSPSNLHLFRRYRNQVSADARRLMRDAVLSAESGT